MMKVIEVFLLISGQKYAILFLYLIGVHFMSLRQDAIKIAKLSGIAILGAAEIAVKGTKELNNGVHAVLGTANSLADSFAGGVSWKPVVPKVAQKVTNKGFDLIAALAKKGRKSLN